MLQWLSVVQVQHKHSDGGLQSYQGHDGPAEQVG